MATSKPTDGSLGRLDSVKSISSIRTTLLNDLVSKTTPNCEVGVLSLKLLMQLLPEYLQLQGNTLICNNQHGGFNLFSNGTCSIDGEPYNINNYIQRKVELKSHFDYKDYRESILSKPMLFLINAKKMNNNPASEKTFALIVNTRHPEIKAQFEGGMNNVISSVFGENYQLQFDLKNMVAQYLESQNFVLTEKDGLSFCFTFKMDVFLDIFYLFGLSKKTCQVNGNITSLHCTKPEKQETVKMLLAKITTPLIKLGGSTDRKPSLYSLNVSDEYSFEACTDYFPETSSVSPLTS
ncbi:mesenteric estrogen-dependent adipogenesis protein [Xenopus laevis]|uniref:Mesenteric estrogen-dependent adipogenesis protein n=2 Tax=Xenopus laevis TaxID=8355 RepID=A0A1L8HIY5_XENLA|nr:mesenteric estrogen-dependent adipogenesis protein [Xenopus laevis]OCT96049.1 hypothetical protein XELAEV_18013731mg [Xenopus laevis]